MSSPRTRAHVALGTALLLACLRTACCAPRAEITGGRAVLDNGVCHVEFDAATGGIASLTPGPESLRGQWFEVIEEDRAGLEPWETWRQGPVSAFAGGPAQVSAENGGGIATVRLTYDRPSGLRIEAEVRLADADPGPLCRLTVRNLTGAVLVDTIRLPVIRGVELGDPQDDWFTWPHTLGARFRANGFALGQTIRQAYPDFLYMQWLDLHDATQGLYVGCLDSYGYCKDLFIGREEDGRSAFGIAFTGCWIARAGDQWTTPWVQMAGHEGDWRAGADLYRPFAQAAFGPLDPPQSVREMPTAQCWLAHHADDSDVGKLFEVQQQAPIHASYLMKSLNTSIPEGWDGMRGSALDLEDAFTRIRELGGSPALFTFDRAPLMGRPNYADYAGRWTLGRRDGSFAEGFRDMMPAPFDSDLWRARIGEAQRWVRDFGIDEIHFDTAATTSVSLAGPCYNAPEGIRPNEVPHYFKAMYRAIRDRCREINRRFILRAEHCADFFMPEFLTSTAHFFEAANLVARHNPPADAELLPILFRYTLPGHAALQMPSMSDDDFWTYGVGMGYGFHGGGPSWCFNPGVREAESPPGELLHRYRFHETQWRCYYDFRVGFEEAVIDSDWSDEIAEMREGDAWVPCRFPGPLVAVTHAGGEREVTLGQWYPRSRTGYFGKRFAGDHGEPGPVTVRVPTRLTNPQARLHGPEGVLDVAPQVSGRFVQVSVPDPTCFALEVFTGPALTFDLPPLAEPGKAVRVGVEVCQQEPAKGELSLSLPAGWEPVEPVAVPAQARFTAEFTVRVPPGIFGRNYPLKATLRAGSFARTTAGRLRVMEPLTVLYAFDLNRPGPDALRGVDPGKAARLTVTCVNNSLQPVGLTISVTGEQVCGEHSCRLEGISLSDLEDPNSPLRRFTEGGREVPACAVVRSFDYSCTGVPAEPVRIRVFVNGAPAFQTDAWPRTRLMDLNGEWKVSLTRDSQALVGGAERNDNLDTEAVTPSVWDGGWQRVATPVRFDEQVRRNNSWAIYRRLVFIPADWQGADIWLRLNHMGALWGQGGTLNLVYVNGWPAGRIWTSGERCLSPFLVFGGWNLVAVASARPNSLVEPYLFARTGPVPERLQPASPGEPPSGPFLLLGQRCTGQGITLPFIQGIPEGDHRRTDVAAGGEQAFIYFAVADAYVFDTRESVEVEVEYLDEGTAPFELHYDSWDENAPVKGAFKAAPPCPRTDTQDWRTHTFVLDDARLANREHQGADFRLHARGTDLRVRRVAVRAPGRCESGIVIGPFSVYRAMMHARRPLPGFSVPVSGLDDQVLLGEPDQAHSLQSMEPSPER